MTISFSKYHGCGNDFICVDARSLHLPIDHMATHLCHRRLGIGADGLVLLQNSTMADYKMTIVNADGSIPEMCGNGLRCLVAFACNIDKASSPLRIETDAGLLTATIIDHAESITTVSLNMGMAMHQATLPMADFRLPDSSRVNIPITISGQSFLFTPVSMGNPHAVVFTDQSISDVGPLFECHDFFPNHVNTAFIRIENPRTLHMTVWERGVGETLACGTGACAAVVAGHITQRCDANATVHLAGGTLHISYNPTNQDVTMIGPAEHVFSGSIMLPNRKA